MIYIHKTMDSLPEPIREIIRTGTPTRITFYRKCLDATVIHSTGERGIVVSGGMDPIAIATAMGSDSLEKFPLPGLLAFFSGGPQALTLRLCMNDPASHFDIQPSLKAAVVIFSSAGLVRECSSANTHRTPVVRDGSDEVFCCTDPSWPCVVATGSSDLNLLLVDSPAAGDGSSAFR